MLQRYTRSLLKFKKILAYTYFVQKQTFQKKMLKTQNFDQVIKLYSEEIQPSLKAESTKKFANTCRQMSKLLRLMSGMEQLYLDLYSSMKVIFGQNFQSVRNFQLNCLHILQIMDIISFCFNILEKKPEYFSHPTFKNWTVKLIELAINKIKKGEMNPERKISFLSKIVKLSNKFRMNEEANYCYGQLFNLRNQFTFFQSQAILYSLNKSQKMLSGCKEYEIFKFILNQSISKNWVAQAKISEIINLSIVLEQVSKGSPAMFLPQLDIFYLSLDTLYQSQYQKLSTTQIIILLKFLSNRSPSYPSFLKTLSTCLGSIHANGSSSLNPIFVMRFLTFCKNFQIYERYSREWQMKVLRMLRYYLIQKKINGKSFIRGVVDNLYKGMFSRNNTEQALEILGAYLREISNKKMQRYIVTLLIQIFQLQLGYFYQFNKITSSLQLLKEKLEKNHIINISQYQYYLFFNHCFVNQWQAALEAQPSPRTVTDIEKREKRIQYLKTFFQQNINMDKKVIQLNLIARSLKYHCKYSWFLQLTQSSHAHRSLIDILSNELLVLSIPEQFHDEFISLGTRVYGNRQNYVNVVLEKVRNEKNVDFRSSYLQAKYTLKLIQKLSDVEKLDFYSNNCVLQFYLLFNQALFIEQVQSILFKNCNIKPGDYQILCFRILSYLIGNSYSIQPIKKAVHIIEKLILCSKEAQKNFHYILAITGLKQRTSQIKEFEVPYINKLSHILTKQAEMCQNKKLQAISSYFSCLQIEMIKNRQNIQEEIRIKKRYFRDMIRVIRYLHHQDNQYFQSVLRPIIYPVFQKITNSQYISYIQKIAALKLCSDINWVQKRLFEKVSERLSLINEYKQQVNAAEVLDLIATYPIQNKWTEGIIASLLNILLICPEKTQFLTLTLGSIGDEKIFKYQFRSYLAYLNGLLNQK